MLYRDGSVKKNVCVRGVRVSDHSDYWYLSAPRVMCIFGSELVSNSTSTLISNRSFTCLAWRRLYPLTLICILFSVSVARYKYFIRVDKAGWLCRTNTRDKTKNPWRSSCTLQWMSVDPSLLIVCIFTILNRCQKKQCSIDH